MDEIDYPINWEKTIKKVEESIDENILWHRNMLEIFIEAAEYSDIENKDALIYWNSRLLEIIEDEIKKRGL